VDNPLLREQSGDKLLFGAGNICNHLLRLDFIKRIIPELKTMYHVAHKAIPVFDPATGTMSRMPGVKLEAFIFDAFELSRRSVILECKREEEFAPMKNSLGQDSPESALKMLLSQFKAELEVSPLEFYSGEDILT